MRSMEAAVARACLTHAADGPAAAEEHKAATLEEERLRHEKRIAFLGTLGNNAPFIGLFGTVLGIVRSFKEMSKDIANASSGVMAGIAEALVATAVGLLVAIPAVVAYNVFKGMVKDSVTNTEALTRVLMAELKSAGKKD